MDYVITAADRALFKRCRRAWDFGATTRQNLEPAVPAGMGQESVSWPERSAGHIDLRAAVREGLAVYYFPGMWEWHNRTIVERLALEAFDRTLRGQRAASAGQPVEPEAAWDQASDLGRRLLERYFRWAPTIDRFSPIRVNTDFHVTLADPEHEDKDLVSVDGRRLLYTGTIDMLLIDHNDAYWLMTHRLTSGDWSDVDLLVLDDVYASYCWAWERFFLGMTIAGVQYNELRLDLLDGSEGSQGFRGTEESRSGESQAGEGEAPGTHMGGVPPMRRMYLHAAAVSQEIQQQQEGPFRRTQVPRSPRELGVLRAQMAGEALEMSDPAARVYPTPSPSNCGPCVFRAPCLVVNEGNDPGAVVASAYRRRPDPEEVTEPRIGSATWSMNRGAAPPGWEERVRRPAEFRPERGPRE